MADISRRDLFRTGSAAAAALAVPAAARAASIHAASPEWSPMFRQYFELKAGCDGLLAYQMGDFFEFFFEDAEIVSEVLNIALTCRGKSPTGQPVPMAGIPTHLSIDPHGNVKEDRFSRSRDLFLGDLVRAGHAVSIALVQHPRPVAGVLQRKIWATIYPPPRFT